MKKKMYKWHRVLSLIVAVPVILWASSGFMHPIMTTIRPKLATQALAPVPVDSNKIRVPLEQALTMHHIDSFTSFRIVHIDTNWFYQVRTPHRKEPLYLSAFNGNVLTAGNWLYAQWLARQFLEGQEPMHKTSAESVVAAAGDRPGQSMEEMHMPVTAAMTMPGAKGVMGGMAGHDCCDAASDCVLNPVKGAKVSDAALVESFNTEYKPINRLLPVYRVTFARADGIRIYVETEQDRFAFAMDDKRRIFDRIFTLVHLWGWLDFLGKGRLVIEFLLVAGAFLTSCMGLYIFFTTKTKSPGRAARGRAETGKSGSGSTPRLNGALKARRNHRYSAVAISLFTLFFTFSGAFHALSKFKEDTRDRYAVQELYAAAGLHFGLGQLLALAKPPVTGVGICRMDGRSYWRVSTGSVWKNAKTGSVAGGGGAPKGRDLMKDAAPVVSVLYVDTETGAVLTQGESKYASWLATLFSGHTAGEILSAEQIRTFTSEYNFTDKRLPVWKISYADNSRERYYVETATGKLSKKINDRDLVEGYSFAFFHKHEFMAWGGKGLKDFSTMFWALAQVFMVIAGLILWARSKRRARPGVGERG